MARNALSNIAEFEICHRLFSKDPFVFHCPSAPTVVRSEMMFIMEKSASSPHGEKKMTICIESQRTLMQFIVTFHRSTPRFTLMMGFHHGNETLVTVTETFFKEIYFSLALADDNIDLLLL